MTAPLDSEAEVRITLYLPVSSQKSVNFEPSGYSLSYGGHEVMPAPSHTVTKVQSGRIWAKSGVTSSVRCALYRRRTRVNRPLVDLVAPPPGQSRPQRA